MKYILVFNGHPRSGKTTFQNAIANKYKSIIYSSINPVIELTDKMIESSNDKDLINLYVYAANRKLPEYRNLLSNIKHAIYSFDNGTFINSKILEKLFEFINDSETKFLMIDIRESSHIKSFIKFVSHSCKWSSKISNSDFKLRTIFVDNDNYELIGNVSDDNVEDYQYDYVIKNTSTLERFTGKTLNEFIDFLEEDFKNNSKKFSLREEE